MVADVLVRDAGHSLAQGDWRHQLELARSIHEGDWANRWRGQCDVSASDL